MIINSIVACSRNNAIGRENQIPWYLPADLKYFKKITSGHVVIMGRKTYESIGRALPKRINIVVSKNKDFKAEHGVLVFSSFLDASAANAETANTVAMRATNCFMVISFDLKLARISLAVYTTP
jgi:dihydrofolate reductase